MSGELYTAKGGEARRFADLDVRLIPETDSTVAAIQRSCLKYVARAVNSFGESPRRRQILSEKQDAAAREYQAHGESAEWRRLCAVSLEYEPSGTDLAPIAARTTDSLLGVIAGRSTATDANGHYSFRTVQPGRYIIAVLRDGAASIARAKVARNELRVDLSERTITDPYTESGIP
ncbi:MAG TPA: hypothetical protein VIP11_19265 [Gemmatimonadaceae bacterium]